MPLVNNRLRRAHAHTHTTHTHTYTHTYKLTSQTKAIKETRLPHAILNIQQLLYLREEWSCLHALHHSSNCGYVESIYGSTLEWIATQLIMKYPSVYHWTSQCHKCLYKNQTLSLEYEPCNFPPQIFCHIWYNIASALYCIKLSSQLYCVCVNGTISLTSIHKFYNKFHYFLTAIVIVKTLS